MAWILVFKLINVSDWPPLLWHPMWITSATPPSAAKCLSLTLCWHHSIHIICLNIEAVTNPTALHLLSVDRRTGLLNILWISSQAVEIHPIFVGLILVLPSKTGKNLIGLCGNTKRYITELGAGFAFGGRGELHSEKPSPKIARSAPEGQKEQDFLLCLFSHAMCQEELSALSSSDCWQWNDLIWEAFGTGPATARKWHAFRYVNWITSFCTQNFSH